MKAVSLIASAMLAPAVAGIAAAWADPATEDDIRIGQTLPYSGPLSGFSSIGLAQAAYFNKLNAEGGINGHKIKFISLDDALSPPKTVEQTRKLVEQDEVLMMFGALGTVTNNAVHQQQKPSPSVRRDLSATPNPSCGMSARSPLT